jgi:DNA-binding response OmpR family regulator
MAVENTEQPLPQRSGSPATASISAGAPPRAADGEIKLTEQELKLLKLFITHKNKPLSRKKLLEIGWGYTRVMSTRTIDNFMVRLRRYFEEDPKKPRYFKSLRSVGYVFTPPDMDDGDDHP